MKNIEKLISIAEDFDSKYNNAGWSRDISEEDFGSKNKKEVHEYIQAIKNLADDVENRYMDNISEGWINHKMTMWALKKAYSALKSAFQGNEEIF